MKPRHSLEEALKELGHPPGLVEDVGAAETRRSKTIAHMRRVQLGVSRVRAGRAWPTRRSLAFAGAALAAVVFGVLLWARSGGDAEIAARRVTLRAIAGLVEVVQGGRTQIVGAEPLALAPEDRVETHAGALASVFLASGATFSVGEGASLRVAGQGDREEVKLELGRVEVHVPKLVQAQGFAVRSPDATVEVRGTRFAVAVSGSRASGTVTVVEVTEGIVAVVSRGKTVELRAGERWSSGDAERAAVPAPEPAPVAGASQAALDDSSPAERALAEGTKAGGAARRPSTLGSENELLAQAMSAGAAGEDGRSLALLDAFLVKHARSPLAENAAVERLRVLSRTGNRGAAARAARRYLSQYPEGVGREFARRLATDGAGAASTGRP